MIRGKRHTGFSRDRPDSMMELYKRVPRKRSPFLDKSSWTPVAVGAVAGVTVTSLGVIAGTSVAAHLARQVVVPPKRPAENVRVLSVGYRATEYQATEPPISVELPASKATLAPGHYGFYFDAGRSFALIGEVLSYSPKNTSVTRRVLSVESGDLAAATRGRFSGVVAPTPASVDVPAEAVEEVSLELEVGEAPAWLIHAPESSCTWAIMVHGMGATRAETLRAVDTAQSLGMTSLHISYRNDREAPPSGDGRYGLGFTEWADVDVAIDYALSHGAQNVVLFGWSMGGAICLQTMKRGRHRAAIRALVLDGPAVDWLELIEYHTQLHKIPLRLGELGVSMISTAGLKFFTGLERPIELETLSWTRQPEEITVPTLIVHSLDDDYVPAASSQKLAEKSPLVDFVPFTQATHTREWNVDPKLWQNSVTSWLLRHGIGAV